MFPFIDVQTFPLILSVVLLVWFYRSTRLPNKFPPGPRCFPIIGSLHALGTEPRKMHLALEKLFKKYGPVLGMKFGSYPTVFITGLEVIREAFITQADLFNPRPSWMFYPNKVYEKFGKNNGLIFQSGEPWKQIRRFTLTSLRDFGVGKKSIEEKIQEEGDILCRELAKIVDEPVDIATLIQQAVSNIICSICFGSRFEYSDPEFQDLMRMLNYNFSQTALSGPINFIPLLQLIPSKCGLAEALRNVENMKAFYRRQIDKHRESFQRNQIRDFIDLYLEHELKENADIVFTPHNIERVIGDLFVAGTETTSTTLHWLFLYLINHPDVQTKCQQEVDRVLGYSRRPCLSDLPNMPYIAATIQETQRLANIAPLSVPRSVKEDTTLCGYDIPKNTLVMASLYSVHMNPDYWDNPQEFRPERWIGPDGNVKKKEAFIPFSVGPRKCIGDVMAKNELFIFFTSILQRFSLKLTDPSNPPSLEGRLGITMAPACYQLILMPR